MSGKRIRELVGTAINEIGIRFRRIRFRMYPIFRLKHVVPGICEAVRTHAGIRLVFPRRLSGTAETDDVALSSDSAGINDLIAPHACRDRIINSNCSYQVADVRSVSAAEESGNTPSC